MSANATVLTIAALSRGDAARVRHRAVPRCEGNVLLGHGKEQPAPDLGPWLRLSDTGSGAAGAMMLKS
jgi:hypothetical protein